MGEVRRHKASGRYLEQKAWVGFDHCQTNQGSHARLNYSMSERVRLRLEVLLELWARPARGVHCRWPIALECHVQKEKGENENQEKKSLEAEDSVVQRKRKRSRRWQVGAEVRLKVYLLLYSKLVGRHGSYW